MTQVIVMLRSSGDRADCCRVNRAALPQLRKQGRGLVVWISSSSARGGTPPYLSPYFAAKAAMDSLAVSYAGELVVDAPFGKRPFRVHIDPSQDGAEIANGVADRVRAELLRRIGLQDLLHPRVA
jgi:NAD(P)-dependent dehydrogenase (short-subunit alcohol dehydrogenase family)